MVFKNESWQWWATNPVEPFWGLVVGQRDYVETATGETITELIVADCTHKYYIFPTYRGDARVEIKKKISHNPLDLKNPKKESFSVVWFCVKRNPVSNELEVNDKLCSYSLINNEANMELLMDIEDLMDSVDTRIYIGNLSINEGLRWEMPTFSSFAEKVERLEQICKREFSDE